MSVQAPEATPTAKERYQYAKQAQARHYARRKAQGLHKINVFVPIGMTPIQVEQILKNLGKWPAPLISVKTTHTTRARPR